MTEKAIEVFRLAPHMRTLLHDRGYTDDTITPRQYAREYAFWHTGTASLADDILDAYDSVKALSND